MIHLTRILNFRFYALAACLLFFGTGSAFVSLLGLQNDESLFAAGIFKPYAVAYKYPWGRAGLPVMVMSYLGALKSWIYRPLFQFFGTGMMVMRLPMLLAGAVSIWLFYLLLRKMAGERAALFGCGLLAADSLYLLTSCFDWGPVALQHLLIISGMLLLYGFYQHGSHVRLGWGCFLLGLAMWDKALALWMLGGIGLALIIIFPRQIVRVISLRRVAISVLFFALGALPLIIYNIAEPLATFRGNTSWDTSDLAGKVRLLEGTADGSALFGWLNDENWQTPNPRVPRGALQSASARISALAGHPRHSLLLYAFGLALLLAPLARGDALRAIVFAVLAMAIGWAQMAVTARAGGSVHHAILLWPSTPATHSSIACRLVVPAGAPHSAHLSTSPSRAACSGLPFPERSRARRTASSGRIPCSNLKPAPSARRLPQYPSRSTGTAAGSASNSFGSHSASPPSLGLGSLSTSRCARATVSQSGGAARGFFLPDAASPVQARLCAASTAPHSAFRTPLTTS